MADLSSVQTLQSNLIRKSLNYSFFAADMDADVVDGTLFDSTTGELKTLPTGYKDLGYITDDGGKFATSISTQDITSLQSTTPTRSDQTGADTTVEIVCQETNLAVLGIYIGKAWDDITPDSTSGVTVVDEPKVPEGREYRLFGISQDNYQGDPIYIGRMLPRTTVSALADQNFSKTAENQWGVTFKKLFDSDAGTAQRWLFGGEGWLALLSDMGFSAGVPVVSTVTPSTLDTAGGDLVTIEGQGFTSASAVKFGGTNATDYTVIDSHTIAAVAPAHAAGSNVAVAVTTPAGTSTGGATVTYAD